MARLARIRPLTALWAAVAAYAAGFGALSVLRHEAFSTGRFDLGNMTQAVWATAHGNPLRVTSLAGEQISRLASHVDPILVAFAPLWWIWPSPNALVVAQAAAIALGALPVYRLAQRHLGSDRAGVAFALTYLVYPATTWMTLDEFHPVAFATPLLLFAVDALDIDRLVSFAVYSVLAALTKEEIPLVIAGLGIWYAIARGNRGVGVAIATAGTAWTFVAVTVVIPHFARGDGAFYGRYREIGGSAGGIAHTALADPLKLVDVAFDGAGVRYLLVLKTADWTAWSGRLDGLVPTLDRPELALYRVPARPAEVRFPVPPAAPVVLADLLALALVVWACAGLTLPLRPRRLVSSDRQSEGGHG